MSRHFLIPLFIVFIFSIAPGSLFVVYYLKTREETSMSWTKWKHTAMQPHKNSLEKEEKTSITQALKPHFRQKIIRQIWFRPLEGGSSLYLKADESEIRLESNAKGFKATEHFKDMEAGFQDQPLWDGLIGSYHEKNEHDKKTAFSHLNDSSSNQNNATTAAPKWIVRVLKSQEAHFDYSKQLLTAEQVDISLYRLSKPLDFTKNALPNPDFANLQGHAKKIYLDCKSHPPQFKASRFKAHVNTQPEKENL
jgi:hypothetical protein